MCELAHTRKHTRKMVNLLWNRICRGWIRDAQKASAWVENGPEYYTKILGLLVEGPKSGTGLKRAGLFLDFHQAGPFQIFGSRFYASLELN